MYVRHLFSWRVIDGRGLTDGGSNGTSNFCDEKHDRSDHCDISMGNGSLCGDLERDGGEAAPDALQDLTPNDLCIGRVRSTRVDH